MSAKRAAFIAAVWRAALALLLALVCAAATPALAQSKNAALVASRCRPASGAEPARQQGEVLLQADSLSYDMASDVAVAEGHVEAAFYECVLVADRLEYDTKSGLVKASGDIAIMEPSGDVVFAKSLELSNGLETGIVNSFWAVLGTDSHLAAAHGLRKSGEITELDHVVYSPCRLCNKPGFEPLWQIRALKVTHDERHKTIRYRDAVMEVKGVPVLWLPYFQHSDPSVTRHSGFLVPVLGHSTFLGDKVEIPYFIDLAPNQDMTLDPLFTSDAGTVLKAQYRLRLDPGSFTLDGSVGYLDVGSPAPGVPAQKTWRSDLFGDGRFRFNDVWSYGFDTQLTSDDTFLRKYQISDLDRLTTRIYAEGFADRDYASVNGYYFQGLREQDNPATTPLVLPLADLTWYPDIDLLGGTTRVDGDFMSLTRDIGGDSTRLSLSGTWERQAVAPGGNLFKLSLETRGDVYYTSDVDPAGNSALPADSEVVGRAIPTLGVEWRWPLARAGRHLYQVIEPIAQVFVSPYGGNPKDIPNDDSSSFEFDETNLFQENKLPGYDLVETGPRANVGFRYAVFGGEGEEAEFVFGENFRLKKDTIFDPATGLGDDRSDFVGSLRLSPNRYFDLIHRFRLDKNNFKFNRNEVIARLGTDNYWGRLSYLKLAPSESDTLTDTTGLEKREEIEAQTHLRIWQSWSIEGEMRRDIANDKMITTGAAMVYSNQCLELQLVYERQFTRDREIQPSATFNIRLRLKTFGENTSRPEYTQGILGQGIRDSSILSQPSANPYAGYAGIH